VQCGSYTPALFCLSVVSAAEKEPLATCMLRRRVLQQPMAPMGPPPAPPGLACYRSRAVPVNGTTNSSLSAPSSYCIPVPQDGGYTGQWYLYLYVISSLVCVFFFGRLLWLKYTGRMEVQPTATRRPDGSPAPAQPQKPPSWKVRHGLRVLLPDSTWAVAVEPSVRNSKLDCQQGTSLRGGSLYAAAVALGILARPLTPLMMGSEGDSAPSSVGDSSEGSHPTAPGAFGDSSPEESDSSHAGHRYVQVDDDRGFPADELDMEAAGGAEEQENAYDTRHVRNGTLGVLAGLTTISTTNTLDTVQ